MKDFFYNTKLEGKEEGVVEARREIVQNALRQGFELDTIARLTGLDVAAIERLAADETVEEGGNGSH